MLLGAAAWQLVRFVLLSLLLLSDLGPVRSVREWLMHLWLPSSQLVLVGVFVMLAVEPREYRSYRHIAVLGKVLDLFPGLVVLVYQAREVFFGGQRVVLDLSMLFGGGAGAAVQSPVVFYFAAAGVVMLDLITLLIVVSFNLGAQVPAGGTGAGETGGGRTGAGGTGAGETGGGRTGGGRSGSSSDNLPEYTETHLEDQ